MVEKNTNSGIYNSINKTHGMNPTERTLQVLEYIMAAGPGPVKQVDIARDCGLSPSTLNRIVRSLSDWGYLVPHQREVLRAQFPA